MISHTQFFVFKFFLDWSNGREDNGSLPLNILSVSDALLEWGVCDLGLAHISFYFENYVGEDGEINYYTWGAAGDSVGDTGRLAELFIKARTLCGKDGEHFTEKYLGVLNSFANVMIRLREASSSSLPAPPTGCKGMIIGPPEHDWSSTKDKYFFNNNVWTLRGMEKVGDYMIRYGKNVTLGNLLLDEAKAFRAQIESCVIACMVKTDMNDVVFLPPYASLSTTPYSSMVESYESSYANFRFFSETLLADVLDRSIESSFLTFHNSLGGRLGGASRWEDHLDDMPTAGWGYGALTNNRTKDFLSLLYGHMASYQSRGSFHATEQLSFQGEGLYRSFLHWPDDFDPLHPPRSNNLSGKRNLSAFGNYYAQEQDISFCIVTEVLAARLTKWQVVFEDMYRVDSTSFGPGIWLARGAPRRWFDEGFDVTGAPTQLGRVSFSVRPQSDGSSVYSVSVPRGKVSTWFLRWPGKIERVTSSGCEILQVESVGIVTIRCDGSSRTFSASALFA